MEFLNKVEGADFFTGLNSITTRIFTAETEVDLTVLLREFNDLVGASGTVFTSNRRDDDFEAMKCIVACPMTWCHEYHARHWSRNDPALIYSETNSEPVLMSDLQFRSMGQLDILRSANSAGFNSGVVIPAHSSMGRQRMGVLYVGSSDPHYFTRHSLLEGRSMLRSVASEMLDWFVRDARMSLLRQVGDGLKPADVELLRLSHQGHISKQIGTILGMSKDAVDQRLLRLAKRFGVSSREKLVTTAYDYGLL